MIHFVITCQKIIWKTSVSPWIWALLLSEKWTERSNTSGQIRCFLLTHRRLLYFLLLLQTDMFFRFMYLLKSWPICKEHTESLQYQSRWNKIFTESVHRLMAHGWWPLLSILNKHEMRLMTHIYIILPPHFHQAYQ